MLARCFILAIGCVVSVWADESANIPVEETSRAPTPARVAALVDAAATRGWGSVAPGLHAAAQQAYATHSGYIPAWYYLDRWAQLLATPYNRALGDWIKAMEAASAGHPNLPGSFEPHAGSLAAGLTRELQIALLGNTALSEEFFQLLSPLDRVSEVLSILQKIHRQDPALFAAYANLAMAIAVVYDVPPPPWWPHGQADAAALSRTLPAPERVFAYFARLDRTGQTQQRLTRLPAAELRFLVDFVAPFDELDWARKSVGPGIGELGKAYDLVKYRQDRVARNQFSWTGTRYALPAILQEGGICVDQAYFASTVGKAKGIPTILFRGAGLDGRHAWFGYLDASQRWQLDCGRYAEQKYVVGLAFDPQTWKDINDHELLFITERFRALPTYKLSQLHAAFARDLLHDGKSDLALAAAREAVNRDRRNLDAWQALLAVEEAKHDGRAREDSLREAVLAFQRYPDLEITFSRQLIAALRARGENSLADFEEQRLGRKYRGTRDDLAIQEAAAAVARSMQHDDLATQLRVFNRLLDTAGQGAGVDFYDRVVVPFVTHLAGSNQVPAALQAVERARRTLRVEPGRQLDQELAALTARLRRGGRKKDAAP